MLFKVAILSHGVYWRILFKPATQYEAMPQKLWHPQMGQAQF